MKKLTVILIVLFAGIILAGCTSQTAAPAATTAATPIPTAAPTPEPTTEAPTAAPTTVATTVAPTATPTATPTPIPDFKVKVAKTLSFEPEVMKIPAGTKVIFYTDAVGYKFKVAIGGVNAISEIITPEASWSYTFTKAGTYTLDEQIYPQFRDSDAKIIVT